MGAESISANRRISNARPHHFLRWHASALSASGLFQPGVCRVQTDSVRRRRRCGACCFPGRRARVLRWHVDGAAVCRYRTCSDAIWVCVPTCVLEENTACCAVCAVPRVHRQVLFLGCCHAVVANVHEFGRRIFGESCSQPHRAACDFSHHDTAFNPMQALQRAGHVPHRPHVPPVSYPAVLHVNSRRRQRFSRCASVLVRYGHPAQQSPSPSLPSPIFLQGLIRASCSRPSFLAACSGCCRLPSEPCFCFFNSVNAFQDFSDEFQIFCTEFRLFSGEFGNDSHRNQGIATKGRARHSDAVISVPPATGRCSWAIFQSENLVSASWLTPSSRLRRAERAATCSRAR